MTNVSVIATALFILVLLIVGLLSGIQAAFVSANKFAFELRKKQGLRSGRIVSDLLENSSSFIASIILALTVFLILYGLLVGTILEPFWLWIETQMGAYTYINYLRLIFETFISGSILLFVIFSFRAFCRAKSDSVLSILAQMRILGTIHTIFNPLASLFVGMANWILKYLFDIRSVDQKPAIALVDIGNFMQQNKDQSDEGRDINTQLFENALQLPTVKIRQCFIPRKEIDAIDINSSIEDLKRKFIDTKLSKLVVYENNIDFILGYVHQTALFKNPTDIQSILLPIPAVPESMSATDLISKFTKERKSIAWVVDEFGGTAGIITMEDLLEEIFGEIRDEYDTDKFVEKQISENEYIFSGRLKLDDIADKYHLDFGAAESETLSGYIIHHHEMIPRVKERIIVGNYEFDIINVSDTRIEMVKMKKLK